MEKNTIVALSTPIGRSAIAVVRLSGNDCIDIAKKIFSPMPKEPNLLKVGKLKTEYFDEHAMCVFFAAPKSFTGENMVEFHCHGGMAASSAVISECLSLGARLAENGEFSKRAFVNGKMNLSRAEGIIEMIDAETMSAAKAASNLLENRLGQATVSMQDSILELLSFVEAALDYPEEDLEFPTAEKTAEVVVGLIGKISNLLKTVTSGRIVKYGIDTAIVGAPNVGKSSLLNALLNSDRAIVSAIPGTTRDTLFESIVFRDIKFNFVDTAGLRQTKDEIEAEGIKRAERAAEQADLVLFVVDDENDKSEFNCNKKVLKVFNKADTFKSPRTRNAENEITISTKTGEGIEALKEKIYDLFKVGEINLSNVVLTNERHIRCLKTAMDFLIEVKDEVFTATLDCVAVKLRSAWEALGEITGVSASEAVIDKIYSKFCLGK